jgi:hypothetical protein
VRLIAELLRGVNHRIHEHREDNILKMLFRESVVKPGISYEAGEKASEKVLGYWYIPVTVSPQQEIVIIDKNYKTPLILS